MHTANDPNHAVHADSPSLSRPLQGKSRASLRRAGDRERYLAPGTST